MLTGTAIWLRLVVSYRQLQPAQNSTSKRKEKTMEAPKFEFAHLGVNARSKEEAEKFLLFCENVLNFKDKIEKPAAALSRTGRWSL